MKKATSKTAVPAMRENYDFAGGVRGKYARRSAQGTNVVLLEPDVAKAFPSAAAVNESLRALAGIIRRRKESPAVCWPNQIIKPVPIPGRSIPAS